MRKKYVLTIWRERYGDERQPYYDCAVRLVDELPSLMAFAEQALPGVGQDFQVTIAQMKEGSRDV